MAVLAIYSDSNSCQISIMKKNNIFDNRVKITTDTFAQSQDLIELLEKIYNYNNDITIETILTCKGVGSFTNVRVCLAIAQGLSVCKNIKLVCPINFEIFYWYWYKNIQTPSLFAISSKRGDYFTQIYKNFQDHDFAQNNFPKNLDAKEIHQMALSQSLKVFCDEDLDFEHEKTPPTMANEMINWYIENQSKISNWNGKILYLNDPVYATRKTGHQR
jgi:tRNA A37 threonylcarbamoyladenosine modification protein TsaB